MSPLTTTQHARLMLVVSIAFTAVLYAVPGGRILAWPLMLLSTLAHEMAHGVAAIFVGGSFERFQMWPDGSGVATWSGDGGRLSRAVVAAGGLVGPAMVAALAFALGRSARGARNTLWGAAAVLLLAELLVVRNLFGFVFVAVLVAGCSLMARQGTDEMAQLLLVFLAVQLALSVFSRADYLFTPVAETSAGAMPSDVAHIAAALLLPYWFWGLACGGLSVVALLYGVRAYWR